MMTMAAVLLVGLILGFMTGAAVSDWRTHRTISKGFVWAGGHLWKVHEVEYTDNPFRDRGIH